MIEDLDSVVHILPDKIIFSSGIVMKYCLCIDTVDTEDGGVVHTTFLSIVNDWDQDQ